jgi:hypothetical protein
MVTKKWCDFRVRKRGRITSLSTRLHTADRECDESETVVTKDQIEKFGDIFDAMEFGPLGERAHLDERQSLVSSQRRD